LRFDPSPQKYNGTQASCQSPTMAPRENSTCSLDLSKTLDGITYLERRHCEQTQRSPIKGCQSHSPPPKQCQSPQALQHPMANYVQRRAETGKQASFVSPNSTTRDALSLSRSTEGFSAVVAPLEQRHLSHGSRGSSRPCSIDGSRSGFRFSDMNSTPGSAPTKKNIVTCSSPMAPSRSSLTRASRSTYAHASYSPTVVPRDNRRDSVRSVSRERPVSGTPTGTLAKTVTVAATQIVRVSPSRALTRSISEDLVFDGMSRLSTTQTSDVSKSSQHVYQSSRDSLQGTRVARPVIQCSPVLPDTAQEPTEQRTVVLPHTRLGGVIKNEIAPPPSPGPDFDEVSPPKAKRDEEMQHVAAPVVQASEYRWLPPDHREIPQIVVAVKQQSVPLSSFVTSSPPLSSFVPSSPALSSYVPPSPAVSYVKKQPSQLSSHVPSSPALSSSIPPTPVYAGGSGAYASSARSTLSSPKQFVEAHAVYAKIRRGGC
jgi:hypothetical protein